MTELQELLDSTGRKITTEDGTYAVQLRRSYAADVHDVWSAWTTPARLSRWLGDLTGETGVDGTLQLTMSPPDQEVAVLHVETCEAPTRLRVRWTWPGEPDSAVELLLEPEADNTVLTLTHSLVGPDTAVDYGYGWEDFLNRLTELLAGRDPAAVSWVAAQAILKPRWSALLPRSGSPEA
ncbi:Activator of Hsp90 ATPase 1 family protein [Kribbella flavida DSM 17836]|uniref:Activator of Hsp90 ATPase 1 family protein n=1 Tax=Kribbella flavida (strain DSM 17836 / JCM 10339 / NBRC 14399) TaxID=479435 RepID=D2PUM6_KRIFD|nr:SRPBCC domain-containing protein [Kribbella flavida]ADB29544.1 Activator of Hsp90 ATPase 1 family protein [Kribbella flavida DSM 17836]